MKNENVKSVYNYYLKKNYGWQCKICAEYIERDKMIMFGGEYYVNEGALRNHIRYSHKGMFEIAKKEAISQKAITESQLEIIELMKEGKKDKEIAQKLGKNQATIRSIRYKLREKEKMCRAFLLLIDQLDKKNEEFIESHRGAKMTDDRYMITKKEYDDIVNKYMKNDRISVFPSKEKRKIVLLTEIAKKFEDGKEYTQKQVNDIIEKIYHDRSTIRRYLIEYGFMKREKDGSKYWKG